MAQQPLNTYKTVTGIVSTTENYEIYTTRTGYTSIVLYAQVGTGLGTVTFSHKRTNRSSSGLTTDFTEIIRGGVVPPNDSIILLEGRLVLERTALKTDAISISGISTSGGDPNYLKYTVSILETLNQ